MRKFLFFPSFFEIKKLMTGGRGYREALKEKYGDSLKGHYDDPAFEVVSQLFRGLTSKKVITPGNYQSFVLFFLHGF